MDPDDLPPVTGWEGLLPLVWRSPNQLVVFVAGNVRRIAQGALTEAVKTE